MRTIAAPIDGAMAAMPTSQHRSTHHRRQHRSRRRVGAQRLADQQVDIHPGPGRRGAERHRPSRTPRSISGRVHRVRPEAPGYRATVEHTRGASCDERAACSPHLRRVPRQGFGSSATSRRRADPAWGRTGGGAQAGRVRWLEELDGRRRSGADYTHPCTSACGHGSISAWARGRREARRGAAARRTRTTRRRARPAARARSEGPSSPTEVTRRARRRFRRCSARGSWSRP